MLAACHARFARRDHAQAQSGGDSDWAADEAVLREQKLPTKGADLLQILRDRTPSLQTAEQFHKNVALLKAAPYGQRVKATDELLKMGPLIRPLLENMLLESKIDPETDSRLRLVLERFPAEKDIVAVTSTARLLQRDKPADSLPVLLDFVPHAANESVRQEVQRAINATGFSDKEPAPLLIESLKDSNPARRAAAAECFCVSPGLPPRIRSNCSRKMIIRKCATRSVWPWSRRTTRLGCPS